MTLTTRIIPGVPEIESTGRTTAARIPAATPEDICVRKLAI
jgi:hypothetical protein